jgi:hypothetical protein
MEKSVFFNKFRERSQVLSETILIFMSFFSNKLRAGFPDKMALYQILKNIYIVLILFFPR